MKDTVGISVQGENERLISFLQGGVKSSVADPDSSNQDPASESGSRSGIRGFDDQKLILKIQPKKYSGEKKYFKKNCNLLIPKSPSYRSLQP
jgi:hypothetical protein